MAIIETDYRGGPDSKYTNLLQTLLLEQLRDLDVDEKINVNGRKDLLGWFKTSESFWRIYKEASRFCLQPRDRNEQIRYRTGFVGSTFQELAFKFLSLNFFPDSVILSPERTLDFYSKLHPSFQKRNHFFGLNSLQGISVPDGMVIAKDGRVLAICEYSVKGGYSYFVNKYENFNKDKKYFSGLFSNSKIVFVVPKLINVPFYFRNIKEDVDFKMLPFNHEQFRSFIDGIFSSFRINPNDASLNDLQKRVREQIERGSVYMQTGDATSEYKRYMERSNFKYKPGL